MFYLVEAHSGCANDIGWFMTVDKSVCGFENVAKPVMLYAVGQKMTFNNSM